MKSQRSNPAEGIHWYAIAVLAAVGTAALVYQSRRPVSNTASEFTATAVVLRQIDNLDDSKKEQIRYSILYRTNLDEAIRKMGLSAAGGIDQNLEDVEAESFEVLLGELSVDVAPAAKPGWCRIGITCEDPHRPERAICIANYLADHYASVFRAARRSRLKSEHAGAVAKSTAAHKAWVEAKTGLVDFMEGHLKSLAEELKPARKAPESSPAPSPALELVGPGEKDKQTDTADKTAAIGREAERLEQLRRRLVLLEEQRDELSEKLTPAHPELEAVDDEIAMVRKRVKLLRAKTVEPAAPRQEEVAEKTPSQAEVIVPEIDLAKHQAQFDSHRATLAKLEKEYQDSLRHERELASASTVDAPIQVQLALGCQIVAAPAGFNFSGLFLAIFAGFIVGLGIVLLARTRTVFRPIATPEEAEVALGVPVAGVVPRSTVGHRRKPHHEQIVIALFAVVLLIAAVVFVWGTIVGGI